MLVYGGNKGSGIQKPRQWGPISAVNASLIKNCQKLGIDAPKVYIPAWEGAGEISDIRSRTQATFGDLDGSWVTGGYKGDAAGTSAACELPTFSLSYPFTVIAINTYASAADRGVVCSVNNSSNYGTRLALANSANRLGKWVVESDNGTTATSSSPWISAENIVGHTFLEAVTLHSATSMTSTTIRLTGDSFSQVLQSTPVFTTFSNLTMAGVGYYVNSALGIQKLETVFNGLMVFDCDVPDAVLARFANTPYSLLQPATPAYYSISSGVVEPPVEVTGTVVPQAAMMMGR